MSIATAPFGHVSYTPLSPVLALPDLAPAVVLRPHMVDDAAAARGRQRVTRQALQPHAHAYVDLIERGDLC